MSKNKQSDSQRINNNMEVGQVIDEENFSSINATSPDLKEQDDDCEMQEHNLTCTTPLDDYLPLDANTKALLKTMEKQLLKQLDSHKQKIIDEITLLGMKNVEKMKLHNARHASQQILNEMTDSAANSRPESGLGASSPTSPNKLELKFPTKQESTTSIARSHLEEKNKRVTEVTIANIKDKVEEQEKLLEDLKQIVGECQIENQGVGGKITTFENMFNSQIELMALDVATKTEEKTTEQIDQLHKKLESLATETDKKIVMVEEQVQKGLDPRTAILEKSIEELSELFELKKKSGSIESSLISNVQTQLEKTSLQTIRDDYTTKKDLNDRVMHFQTLVDDANKKSELIGNNLRNNAEKFSTEMKDYVTRNDFNNYTKLTATKEAQDEIKAKCKTFATITEMTKNVDTIKRAIDAMKESINHKCAKVSEQKKMEQTLKQFIKEKCLYKDDAMDRQTQVDKKLKKLDDLARYVNDIKRQSDQITAELPGALKSKVDKNTYEATIKTLEKRFDTFALLTEYEELYQKVVPAVATAQDQYEMFMKEHEQIKEVIQHFDEQRTNYALKHEIVQYSKELRYYQKARPFDTFKMYTELQLNTLEGRMEQNSEQINDFYNKIEQQVQRRVGNAMSAFKMEMNRRHQQEADDPANQLNQLNYSEASGSDENNNPADDLASAQHVTISSKKKNAINQGKQILELLSQKADKEDIVKLQKSKTNKEDTGLVISNVRQFHKMIVQFSCLIEEMARRIQSVSGCLNEGAPQKQAKANYLFEQSRTMHRWVSEFDTEALGGVVQTHGYSQQQQEVAKVDINMHLPEYDNQSVLEVTAELPNLVDMPMTSQGVSAARSTLPVSPRITQTKVGLNQSLNLTQRNFNAQTATHSTLSKASLKKKSQTRLGGNTNIHLETMGKRFQQTYDRFNPISVQSTSPLQMMSHSVDFKGEALKHSRNTLPVGAFDDNTLGLLQGTIQMENGQMFNTSKQKLFNLPQTAVSPQNTSLKNRLQTMQVEAMQNAHFYLKTTQQDLLKDLQARKNTQLNPQLQSRNLQDELGKNQAFSTLQQLNSPSQQRKPVPLFNGGSHMSNMMLQNIDEMSIQDARQKQSQRQGSKTKVDNGELLSSSRGGPDPSLQIKFSHHSRNNQQSQGNSTSGKDDLENNSMRSAAVNRETDDEGGDNEGGEGLQVKTEMKTTKKNRTTLEPKRQESNEIQHLQGVQLKSKMDKA